MEWEGSFNFHWRSSRKVSMIKYIPYLKSPAIWPEIGRRVIYRMKMMAGKVETPSEIEQARQQATRWCERQSISTEEALHRLGIKNELIIPIQDRFAADFQIADQHAKRCPVKMGGGGNLDLVYYLCDLIKTKKAIETGVAYGWSSLAILLSISQRQGTKLISIDLPYFELQNDRWVGVVVPRQYHDHWQIYRMADREGLPKAIKKLGTIDFAHYDSDKTYQGRRWAYDLLWKALRPGGMLISDDINDNLGFHDFCEEQGIEPVLVAYEDKYQGVLVKPNRKSVEKSD